MSSRQVEAIPLNRIFLNPDNPRHEPVKSESEAIDKLCASEDIPQLARDIAQHGLNPLEKFALLPIKRRSQSGPDSYYVAEGNRRICALKLLLDPDLAPSSIRSTLERLSNGWSPIEQIEAVVFRSDDDLRIWLDRTHNGPQGGIGRRQWKPEQKQRFDGGTKNRLALSILEYAEASGLVTAGERSRKLTTAQRFLANKAFRQTLGISEDASGQLLTERSPEDFHKLLGSFMRDMVENRAHSRMNKPDIEKYAQELPKGAKASLEIVAAHPIGERAARPKPQPKAERKAPPKKPPQGKFLHHDPRIAQALNEKDAYKLQSLYHSLGSIETDVHTPVLSIVAWAFMETLTRAAGRKDGTTMSSYLSEQTLCSLGFADRDIRKALRAAVDNIHRYGDTSKHHATAATFNAAQLSNDLETLGAVILALIAKL